MSANGQIRAQDDLAQAQLCLAGDERAWDRLLRRHRPTMVELALRILPEGAAQDLVDSVIADIWERRKLAAFQGRSSLATWLGAVTINAALNAKRAAAPREVNSVAAEDAAAVPVLPEPEGDRQHLATILSDAIAALPSELKVLVLMYYEQGLTLDEAAVVLGRSKSTLSRSLRQARESIHDVADRLSRDRLGVPLTALRRDEDLGRLEIDLRAACARERQEPITRV